MPPLSPAEPPASLPPLSSSASGSWLGWKASWNSSSSSSSLRRSSSLILSAKSRNHFSPREISSASPAKRSGIAAVALSFSVFASSTAARKLSYAAARVCAATSPSRMQASAMAPSRFLTTSSRNNASPPEIIVSSTYPSFASLSAACRLTLSLSAMAVSSRVRRSIPICTNCFLASLSRPRVSWSSSAPSLSFCCTASFSARNVPDFSADRITSRASGT
mmetsp:Transcript_45357/g.150353  ORF Transcript_45357/g.150353 Transcript_45357/m.150353 type:complete len:220 (-) Transcript_45357:578-1237(-)